MKLPQQKTRLAALWHGLGYDPVCCKRRGQLGSGKSAVAVIVYNDYTRVSYIFDRRGIMQRGNLKFERSVTMVAKSAQVEGTLQPDGTLILDEKPALPPGRVRVALQAIDRANPPLDVLTVLNN